MIQKNKRAGNSTRSGNRLSPTDALAQGEATEMATVLPPPAQNVILHNLSWGTYERLLADLENSSAPRLTYDRGTLEIMSPLPEQERAKQNFTLLVDEVTGAWE